MNEWIDEQRNEDMPENSTMKRIYVYTRSTEQMQVVEGPGDLKLIDLIDVGDGEHLWPDDESDLPLPATATVESVGHGRRVFCGTCHKVIVVVRYNGETVSREFRPGAPIRRILRWAVREAEFGITDPAPADFDLRMCSVDVVPDGDDLVGSFVGDDCEVCFDLRPTDKFQG